MGATSIEWAHYTLNPWRGCTKATFTGKDGKTLLHPGCLNCYAEQDRSVKIDGIKWGKGQERKPKAESGWKEPLSWARKAAAAGERHRVFCASLADVLDPEVPDSMRDRLWDVILRTAAPGFAEPHLANWTKHPGLDWLVLTKRPENWRMVPKDVRPLVWLGTSVSDQQSADEWGGRLREAHGFRLKFYSVEPMVAAIQRLPLEGTSWVICGGESGPKARPCNVEWVRSIVRQCADAQIPCHVKQMGSVWAKETYAMTVNEDGEVVPDKKGGDMKNWPEDLRVREFPR